MCRIAVLSRVAVLLALWICPLRSYAAELVPIHSLDSLESRLLTDAADGRLDRFTLLQGALIAGGLDQADQLQAAQEQLESKWRELEEKSLLYVPPRERIRIILAALHRLLLTGKFKADCTAAQIQEVIAQLKPLPGAIEFVNWLRERFQVVIISDTFYQ